MTNAATVSPHFAVAEAALEASLAETRRANAASALRIAEAKLADAKEKAK